MELVPYQQLENLDQPDGPDCAESEKTCPMRYNSCGIGCNAATLYSRNRKAIVLQKKKRIALPPITVKQLLKKVDKTCNESVKNLSKKKKKKEATRHSAPPTSKFLPSIKQNLSVYKNKNNSLVPITSMSFNPSLSFSMFVGVLPNILKTYVDKFDNLLKSISEEHDKHFQSEFTTSEQNSED